MHKPAAELKTAWEGREGGGQGDPPVKGTRQAQGSRVNAGLQLRQKPYCSITFNGCFVGRVCIANAPAALSPMHDSLPQPSIVPIIISRAQTVLTLMMQSVISLQI